MRRKTIKKKLVAFGLATAMALSVITVPYTGGGMCRLRKQIAQSGQVEVSA